MGTTFHADASYCRAARLTATKFVVVFQDRDNNFHAMAAAGTLSGTDITFGPHATMDSNWTGTGADTFAVCALDESRALAVWQDYYGDDSGRACVLTVSGLDVTAGPVNIWLAGSGTSAAEYYHLAPLSSTQAVLAYQDELNGNYGTAKVFTVSGNDLTAGPAHVFNAAETLDIDCCGLDGTRAAIAFRTQPEADGKTLVAEVSGSDITFGAAATFQTGAQNVHHISVARLDAGGRYAVFYKNDDLGQKGYAKVATTSGAAVSLGPVQELYSGLDWEGTRAARLGDDRVALVTKEGAGSEGVDRIVAFSGDTAVASTPRTWLTGTEAVWAATDAVSLDGENVVVVYRDATTYNGIATLLQYAATTTAPPTTTIPPATTTAPPTTTIPPATTTAPPATTTAPPATTTTIPPTPHPADTNADFAMPSSDVLPYADAYLTNDDSKFPGVSPPNRTAYVLRAAWIFLHSVTYEYEDIGTAAPIDSQEHPQRWQPI